MNKQNIAARRIGALKVAEKLMCHPASVPRLVREGRLPPPEKILNKNTWREDVIDAVIPSLHKRRNEAGYRARRAKAKA
jgi:hypothetical protein